MAKNLMKKDIFEPKDYSVKSKFSNNNIGWNSSPTKYSIHFDPSLHGGSFYIFYNQLPSYILEKIKYREDQKIFDISFNGLHEKIKDIFELYLKEVSNIKYEKKIAIKFYNKNSEKDLNISINYIIFKTKQYLDENNKVIEEKNIDLNSSYQSVINLDGYEIYEYSEILEDSIKNIQKKLHNGMENFIKILKKDTESILTLSREIKLLGENHGTR